MGERRTDYGGRAGWVKQPQHATRTAMMVRTTALPPHRMHAGMQACMHASPLHPRTPVHVRCGAVRGWRVVWRAADRVGGRGYEWLHS
jgi:hypothetical protein